MYKNINFEIIFIELKKLVYHMKYFVYRNNNLFKISTIGEL